MDITLGLFLIMTFGVALAILAFKPSTPEVSTLEKVDYYSFKDDLSFFHYGTKTIGEIVALKNANCSSDFSRATLENLMSTIDSWNDKPKSGNTSKVESLLKSNKVVVFACSEGDGSRSKVVYIATNRNYVDTVYVKL